MRISELISQLTTSADQSTVAQLERMIAGSVFGLMTSGLPKAEPGQKFVVDGTGSVTMQFVGDPNGRRMIKACADPELFDTNYPGGINAWINGRELIEMAEQIHEADGILICSATSLHSFPIYKSDYQRVKMAKTVDTSRSWWQFWKPA